MLRKCLELLGLCAPLKKPDLFVKWNSCETLDSILVLKVMGNKD